MRLALFDIDGVLANDDHRVQLALEKRWSSYFTPSTVAQDTVWEEGLEKVLEVQAEGWTIGYLTGRGQSLKETTEKWLDKHGFPFGRVVTRGWWSGSSVSQPTTANKPTTDAKAKDKGPEKYVYKAPTYQPREVLSEFKARIIREILLRPDIEDVVLFEDDPEVVRVVQEEFGPTRAVLIPWHVKPEALVKKATA